MLYESGKQWLFGFDTVTCSFTLSVFLKDKSEDKTIQMKFDDEIVVCMMTDGKDFILPYQDYDVEDGYIRSFYKTCRRSNIRIIIIDSEKITLIYCATGCGYSVNQIDLGFSPLRQLDTDLSDITKLIMINTPVDKENVDCVKSLDTSIAKLNVALIDMEKLNEFISEKFTCANVQVPIYQAIEPDYTHLHQIIDCSACNRDRTISAIKSNIDMIAEKLRALHIIECANRLACSM